MSSQHQHTKVITKDRNGNARLKFQSSKKRKPTLTSDIYRRSEKKLRDSNGVAASIATREARVHHPPLQKSSIRAALEDVTTTFATELDVAMDRNASELFRRFYYEIWPLVRSLPEILHHHAKIINLLLLYMLSPIEQPNEKSELLHCTTADSLQNKNTECASNDTGIHIEDQQPRRQRHLFRPNLATVDLLHLLAVLARDVRHEIHEHVHTQILPRLYYDFLNPPSAANGNDHIPQILDVSLIELVFRTVSYLFKYDMEAIIHDPSSKIDTVSSKKPSGLESLRLYYGITLGHPNETIRRLSAESFAPVIRQSPVAARRHLRRVLRALSLSANRSDDPLTQSHEYAVDGIAHLFFEVCRGSAGRLHSKCGPVVVAAVLDAVVEMHDSLVVQKVVDAFFRLLCNHLQAHHCVTVLESLVHAVLQKCSDSQNAARIHLLHALNFILTHRNGVLLREESSSVLPMIDQLFSTLLRVDSFRCVSLECRDALLQLLFATLPNFYEENAQFGQRIIDSLRSILGVPVGSENDIVASRVIQNFIPQVPIERSMPTMGTDILEVAVRFLAEQPEIAMTLIHGLATIPIHSNGCLTNDQGDIFFLDRARYCVMSQAEKARVLQACGVNDVSSSPLLSNQDQITLIVSGKVASFIVAVGLGDGSKYRSREAIHDFWSNFHTVSNWHVQMLQRLERESCNDPNSPPTAIGMIRSMLIESVAVLCSLASTVNDPSSAMQSALTTTRPIVRRHILSKSHNLWALKSTVSFVRALQSVNMLLSDDTDDIFDALIPCLRSRNHFHRLYALQILVTFPKRPYVVDHADLDLADDLDEEQDALSVNPSSVQHAVVGLTGPCNVMEILLGIENTPVNINTERSLLSNISRIGVLGRTGKLPVIYAEAAISHLLGLFYVKYEPLWSVSVKSLVDLAHGHEDCVWPALHGQIALSIDRYDIHRPVNEFYDVNRLETNENRALIDPVKFYSLCHVWETSNGEDASLFSQLIQISDEQGLVSRHLSTEESTVFASLWNVVQGAPKLLLTHSRTIVPVFLNFMQYQYYEVLKDDPDVRELRLSEVLNEISDIEPIQKKQHDVINGRQVQQRLLCVMKAFSCVNGPHQLFKHKVLLSIFMSLVGSQDSQLSQLALSCVIRFKLPHITPYANTLKKFYEKGKLRETMLELHSDADSGKIDPAHRAGLIPVVARILFGRLSAKRGATKSSKDSPASRRIATLSFLASFCRSDDELYPFLYLMTRVYIPRSYPLLPLEMQDASTRKLVVGCICTTGCVDYGILPTQIHQGFLNVLGVVISQLGHKISAFVPSLLSIVISLCKVFEVKDKDDTNDCRSNDHLNEDEDFITQGVSNRRGTIRSLCYNRLSDIFETFSDSLDLHEHSGILWESLGVSLRLLPVMVLNSEKVPSLLKFLQTVSSIESVLGVLNENQDIVPSVLRCLSESSKIAVVESVLSFIENLLDVTEGRQLLHQHIELMLDRFFARLRCAEPIRIRGSNDTARGSVSGTTCWRRELAILCRVCELVGESNQNSNYSGQSNVMESLCLLLVPFLDLNKGIPDADKQRVLDILEVMVVKVPSTCAASLYCELGSLFGLFKAKVGMPSLVLRKSLAFVLSRIADTTHVVASCATQTLLQLCAVNSKRVNEMDFDTVIPAISKLAENQGDASWLSLCSLSHDSEHDPSLLLPIVNSCFCFLLNDDGVVSRSAFKALISLVTIASDKREEPDFKWKKLLESSIVPVIKSGLSSHSEFVRRLFILLLKEVVFANKGCSSTTLFTDLNCLIQNDEPDLDFFLNITHVQLHRRSRALQRLRKLLVAPDECHSPMRLSVQSLSSVLLPLATHPIYECKTKIEESFALEGIATVGAIARHLSWSKYNTLLWNHLNQFDRHPEQEKYLVGLVCAIIDSFHFQVECQNCSNDDPASVGTNSIWRALENRIIPKVECLLLKEKDERKGKVLRPSILLALHKLIHKLPTGIFQAKLPRLLTVVCDALRNRESDARDVARVSLAKMVTEMDMAFLADVLRELATSLNEGYKLHVRSAVVHTILLEISKDYKPPDNINDKIHPSFDQAVPAFMDLIQQDIFGEAQERKDAQESQVRFVKEASGSKSTHSLELLAAMILFRPFSTNDKKPFLSSSIHVLVTPFIERLRATGLSIVVARRIKECLTRIVAGLLRNPSMKGLPVIQFVFATLEPFVSQYEMELVMEVMDDDISSDEDNDVNPIKVSGKRKSPENIDDFGQGQVLEWRPSTLKSAVSTKAARFAREIEEKEKYKVQDGASAPKLTGSSRMAPVCGGANSTLNDTSTISAVIFGLQLLSPSLKNCTDDDIPNSILDKFVPLLTTCVCRCRTTDVVLLSLRCLGWLLKTKLPSLSSCSKSLAAKTLELLTNARSNQEQLQASFKMLTLLISNEYKQQPNEAAVMSICSPLKSDSLPLNDDQLRVLLSYIRESIVSSDQHNSALALTKAIMSHRYVSVELYDLMNTLLEQSVRSSKSTVRDQCGVLFLHYLINFPLSTEKIEQHLKQVVLNISYEYAEGRLSAISLVSMFIDKLPAPILEEHCQLFFLPLTLQLVNDNSKDCRELVAKCISKLLRNVSLEVAQSLYGYVDRWSNGDVALQRMSLRLYAILVDVRPDLLKRNDTVKALLAKSQAFLEGHAHDWEIVYFTLLLIETMNHKFSRHIVSNVPLWKGIIHSMIHEHAWVKMAAVRLITSHCQSLDPVAITLSKTFLAEDKDGGMLFSMARNLCHQFSVDEAQHSDEITTLVVKGLTWTLPACSKLLDYPDDVDATTLNDDPSPDRHRDPVQWILDRLSRLARPKAPRRRQAIFKCFATFATQVPVGIWSPHLEKMIEPLYRAEIEARNDAGTEAWRLVKSTDISEEAQLARDVLQLLETPAPERFLSAYQQVQQQARKRKEARKAQQQTTVVTDPVAAAQQRIQKQTYEKQRRQRRVQERREQRGGTKKRRHV